MAELLRRCLEKDSKRRVRDIGDVRLAMEGAVEITATQQDGATVFACPVKNIHTVTEMSAMKDLEAYHQLLTKYLSSL